MGRMHDGLDWIGGGQARPLHSPGSFDAATLSFPFGTPTENRRRRLRQRDGGQRRGAQWRRGHQPAQWRRSRVRRVRGGGRRAGDGRGRRRRRARRHGAVEGRGTGAVLPAGWAHAPVVVWRRRKRGGKGREWADVGGAIRWAGAAHCHALHKQRKHEVRGVNFRVTSNGGQGHCLLFLWVMHMSCK